ncbi:MAG: cobyric acid synthase [Acidimicrobiales bacterium]
MGALLVAGTCSDAGKSVVVAGLCRWLAREGVRVAPFKAQNMSLSSFVTRDGAEIGRAQAAQAQAAGVEPEAVMNPVLLKPGSDTTSQLVVLGRPVGEIDAARHWRPDPPLAEVVQASFEDLASRFEAVVCEGAGSLAEMNLREADIVNLGFARRAGVPVVVVGDIDRGGLFAALVGSLAVLEPDDQRLVAGFVVNKFRGDRSLLEPGLRMLQEITGRPTLGVLPFVESIGVDAEDAIDWPLLASSGPPVGEDVLRVHVVALPRMSNHTDADSLAVEPGVVVRFVRRPAELHDADLIVLPGTRATVDDLTWLRRNGLDVAIRSHVAAGRALLGICGGYQMLGTAIDDRHESRAGAVPGLGLLPVRTRFQGDKVLGRPSQVLAGGRELHGYEIHQGVVVRDGGDALVTGEGCRLGQVTGTVWHGLLENDWFRRSYMVEVARAAGRRFVPAADTSFPAVREARLDRLGDLVAAHLDLGALRRLLAGPVVPAPVLRLVVSGEDHRARAASRPGATAASERSEMTHLEPGDTAPTFTLPDQDGKPVSLGDFAGRQVVVYFYPKDETPGCTTEACQFNDNLSAFERSSVEVIGISPDGAADHRSFRAAHGLRFSLLSDPDHEVMERYGAWGEKTMYGKPAIGVIRSTFLVDGEGRVQQSWYNVKAEGHAEKVLAAIA